MASGPITSWQAEGEKVEVVTDFIYLPSKITVDDDSGHEFKRRLLLGRKAMTNLDSTLKSRDITWPTKICIVKDMVFPVIMYKCESWTIKKAEYWRTDAFKLWYWRRLLGTPLPLCTANERENQCCAIRVLQKPRFAALSCLPAPWHIYKPAGVPCPLPCTCSLLGSNIKELITEQTETIHSF